MRKMISFLFVVALLSSCASSGPSGLWDYTVTGTPQGDYSGTLNVTKKDAGFAATLNSQAGEASFEKFSYDKKTSKTSGEFYFSGVPISFSATVVKDKMTGTMGTGGMEWPFAATKKK